MFKYGTIHIEDVDILQLLNIYDFESEVAYVIELGSTSILTFGTSI